MQYKLYKPQAFTEIGRKSNNEDKIYPDVAGLTASERCFVLCDGMGGHENGEVAAEIVATTLQPTLLASKTEPDIITRQRFNDALATTYAALDKMTCSPGKTPGTTMTCLYFAANGVLVAHIGDSRVYQVRPGVGIVFMTSDHSLVNELVKAGQLTPEEAKTFPRRNVITRAMQPGQEDPCRADISILTDIRPGDYFFMCTDGILENIDDDALLSILSDKATNTAKLGKIYERCFGQTRDNFTCILVGVENVEGEPLPTPADNNTESATIAMSAAFAGKQAHAEDTQSMYDENTRQLHAENTEPLNRGVDLEKTDIEGNYAEEEAPKKVRKAKKRDKNAEASYTEEDYEDDSEFDGGKKRKRLSGWIEFAIAVGITAIIIGLMFVFFKAPSEEELKANKNKEDDSQKNIRSEQPIEQTEVSQSDDNVSDEGQQSDSEDTGEDGSESNTTGDTSDNPESESQPTTEPENNQPEELQLDIIPKNNGDNPQGSNPQTGNPSDDPLQGIVVGSDT